MSAGPGAGIAIRVFLPFALGYYLSYALRTVNAVISPELTRELGVSAADLGLLTSAYFLTFAAFQIPLGMLLDRYGARRVEAALLLIAAAGCGLFSMGRDLSELALARGLIGLGVSACLMASFKSFHQWFSSERQPALVGAIMVAGTLGALSASLPLERALPLLGWRGVFVALAAAALLTAALIFTVPERSDGHARETLGEQLRGVAQVFASRVFWRFAPQTGLVVGGFLALQGLWAVPWLMSVEGMTRTAAATVLFEMNLALLVGYASLAGFATRLVRKGIKPEWMLTSGLFLALLAQAALVAGIGSPGLWWSVVGLSVCVGNLAYPLLTAQFPPQLAGRANTALNLLAFVGAFGIQWGFGGLVDALRAAGFAEPQSYRISLGVLLAFEAAAFGWFALSARERRS